MFKNNNLHAYVERYQLRKKWLESKITSKIEEWKQEIEYIFRGRKEDRQREMGKTDFPLCLFNKQGWL